MSTKRRVERFSTCVWCGEKKPIRLMRHPSSSRGKTPTTCHSCREKNPELGWCDFHQEPHPKSEFTPNNRPIGIDNRCVSANSYIISQKRALKPIECMSCRSEKDSWHFRGGRNKAVVCRDCESENDGFRFCIGCDDWLTFDNFSRTGDGKRFHTVRCRPCRTAHTHGTTVSKILEIQGVDSPECGSCGATDNLKIDHDHRCCKASRSCGDCVRGYLCHECNTSEGLLRSAARARMLADYMDRNYKDGVNDKIA